MKVRTTLDDTGERMWATALGNDLFEINNIPFLAFDLHYQDVVLALAQDDEHVPVIVRIVRRSGHKTLRIIFSAECDVEDREEALAELERRGIMREHAHGNLWALSVPPDSDYPGVCSYLEGLEARKTLTYEHGVTSEDPSRQAFPSDLTNDKGH